GRDAETACDPGAVAADLADLPELIRERHFPTATGVVGPDALDRAGAAIAAHRARIDETRPRTWGDALGSLNDELRGALRDRAVGIAGPRASRIREAEPRPPREPDAPPVEVSEHHGVLCVKVRRFYGDLDADAALDAWSRSGAAQLDHDRIIVDVRGNP